MVGFLELYGFYLLYFVLFIDYNDDEDYYANITNLWHILLYFPFKVIVLFVDKIIGRPGRGGFYQFFYASRKSIRFSRGFLLHFVLL